MRHGRRLHTLLLSFIFLPYVAQLAAVAESAFFATIPPFSYSPSLSGAAHRAHLVIIINVDHH
jgi:hypothetical protein